MTQLITIFLCGDVMLGRGIDQALPHSVDAMLHEPYVKDAQVYVDLAEQAHGAIDRPLAFETVWGDALPALADAQPALRVINLETSITTSDHYDRDKGIHYRMHPRNIPVLTAAGIDCCVLANNHVMDWGQAGLVETLDVLQKAGIASVGAGRDARDAAHPTAMEVDGSQPGRVMIFAYGAASSGVPRDWQPDDARPGVNVLPNLHDDNCSKVIRHIRQHTRNNDVVVVSLHWGGNWGYPIPGEQVRFAHDLINEAGVDIVFGHSSHHAKGIEVYEGRLILYGCGDFINDYEGIGGHEEFHPDLSLMYLPRIDAATGELRMLRMIPMRMHRFRLHRASPEDTRWLRDTLTRESARFGVSFEVDEDGALTAAWE